MVINKPWTTKIIPERQWKQATTPKASLRKPIHNGISWSFRFFANNRNKIKSTNKEPKARKKYISSVDVNSTK